jgi:glycosidase
MKRKSFLFALVIFYFLAVSFQVSREAAVATETFKAVQYGKPFDKVPDPLDVTIYQVNIRSFSGQGNFNGIIPRLDSIKDLGANVIFLMPIYPVGVLKTVNSPYCIRDYLAVNPEFGTLEDLRRLVEEAHKRELAVILDFVANHTSWDNVWMKNKLWYQQDESGNIISPPGHNWRDVAQLNFKKPETRQALIGAMKYWVLSANVDGFRCDYTDGPPFDFWKAAIDTLRNNTGHKLIMLSEGSRPDHFSAGFDYNFGFRTFDTFKRIYRNNMPVTRIDSLNVTEYLGATDRQRVVRYTSNHDVNGSDGTPLELFNGVEGSLAAFVVAAYMKSVPMIYNGQEKGLTYRLQFPFTSRDIDWSLNPGLTAEYKKIIGLRNSSAAIRRGDLKSYSTDDVCAFVKTAGSEKVLVLVNLRNRTIEYIPDKKLQKTKWKNLMEGGKMKVQDKITLEPFKYLVLEK